MTGPAAGPGPSAGAGGPGPAAGPGGTRFPPHLRLPAFPWDALVPYAEKARAHPDGLLDLSIGTPVDPVPAVVQDALAAAADSPGYPAAAGTAALTAAACRWLARRTGAEVAPHAVIPTVGSKELVALLPALLGVAPGSLVVHPSLAYPTYDIGARFAGATRCRSTRPVRTSRPSTRAGSPCSG